MKTEDQMKYTYKLGRKCEHCDAPIADHIHKLRTHCPREVMPDGSIKNCKDNKNTEKKAKTNPPFNAIAKHHKKMHCQINLLINKIGDEVSIQDLNKYGIQLNSPVQFQKADGYFIFLFVGFKITQLANNKYRIEQHDRIF